MSRQGVDFQAMSAKDMYPIPTPVASRSRPAGVGDLRVPFFFPEQWRKKCFLTMYIIYIYISIYSIFGDWNDWIITEKSWFSGSSPTGKPLRKLMHSPPSRWFVLPASVVWAGLHVPRRWDEKDNIYTFFLGGKGWGGGVLGCLDVCFCLNVFFGCCVFECFFWGCGEMMQCFVFLFMFFALGEFLWVLATFVNCFFWSWNLHQVEGEAARSAKCPCLIISLGCLARCLLLQRSFNPMKYKAVGISCCPRV